MAEANILRVIEELDVFLIEKANCVDHITEQAVEMAVSLKNDLRLILDFVADKELEEGSSLKYWLSDVVEIAEDALLLIREKIKSDSWRSEPPKRISYAMGEARKLILQHGVEAANKSPIITSSSSPQKGEEEECVVGLEEDVDIMLRESFLREKVEGFHATCILGMVGTGKTTLAREVYNHPTIVDQYDPRVWVSVCGEASNKEVLMKLILQLLHDKDQSVLLRIMENADNRSLKRVLKKHLQGKNFLIVLDDIGKIPYFESILKVFADEGYEACKKSSIQSRLLLTSRFLSLKALAKSFLDIFSLEMKPLDDDRSWQLFLKLLLFGNQKFPKAMEKKGREMLRSCAGLPLSIKEVATQFVIKRQGGSEWEELLQSIDLSETRATLESIYHRWSPQLKSCFLCLSFFMKGTPIRRVKLVHVWAAAQVIPEKEEEEVYTDYEKYNWNWGFLEGYKTTLMKLVDESIIEVDLNKNWCIKCIRINESFHKLSIVKAEEEMVLQTLKMGKSNLPNSREPRHRAICCSRDEFNHFTDHDERLVSLFFRGGGYFDASGPYWKRFKQLRTLDFEGFGLKILPDTIGTLIELRYLGLRDNYIQELPQSLGHLQKLEVLDIALNFSVEVPDIVWEIGSVRHLYMSGIICRNPLRMGTLRNLKTFVYISLNNWTYKTSRLKRMTNLRKLGIEEVDENSNVSKLFAALAYLTDLDCLIIRGFRFRSLPSLHGLKALDHLGELRLDGLITELPSADIFPPRISRLTLINSCLDEDPMPELGKLKDLSYLKLKNAYTGEQMVIPEVEFHNLRVLCLEELWHLRNIRGYLYLDKLEIKSCPYLDNIPENIILLGEGVKMLTTRRLAAKIRKSERVSEIEHVDIQP